MIVRTILPEGLTMRAGTLADLESVYSLLQAYELAFYGQIDETLDRLRSAWTLPDIDLAEDTRLVFERSGRLVGYMRLSHNKHAKFLLGGCVLPDYPDPRLRIHLLELAEIWARERMAQAEPGVRVSLSGALPSNDHEARRLYEQAGLQEIRRFWRMEIELNAAPPAPVWPEGIELRPYVPGRDERTVFEVIDTAFQDHWGHIPNRFEQWKHWTIEREHFDPSAWFVAYRGEQAVGGAFCDVEEGFGWVDDLAVLRAERGKGLGMALLLHAFGDFYRRGLPRAGLGVDSQNLTGALRLYQRAGMHRVLEDISYEKELRAGVELSTRALSS